jgi:hypothetical protein
MQFTGHLVSEQRPRAVPTKVRPDREFRAEIEKLCGAEAIEVLAN